MKRSLLERIRAGETLLADGALGTMLIARGLKPGECPESWNVTHPDTVAEIARLYLDAGSEVISTNTFGATSLKLAGYGLAERAAEFNEAGVRILRQVVGSEGYVAASCGPTGRLLKPYGDTDPPVVYEAFRAQVAGLARAGADAILFETMTDLEEATLAIKAAREAAPELPVIATMTFDRIPRGFYTIMGTGIDRAAKGLKQAGADVIGSNCGNGSENMALIAAEFRRRSDLPLVIQSNAGLPEVRGETLHYRETPEFMAGLAAAMVEGGLGILGGCCGTTPGHIAAFRRLLDQRRPPG